MTRTAVRTIPMSYSKTFQPSRAAEASALRTGLGSVSLVNLDIHGLPSGKFVPQHMSECGPAGIIHGLCHPRLGELGGVHIADSDQRVFSRQFATGDVKMMAAGIGDLRMYRPDASVVAGSPSLGEFGLMLPVLSRRRYFSAIAASSQRLEPKINADLTNADSQILIDPALKSHIPAATRILHECPRFEDTLYLTRLPEAQPAIEINNSITVYLYRPRNERNPTERALRPKTGAKARALTVKIARGDELSTNARNRIRVQVKAIGGSGAKVDQIKRCRPSRGQAGHAAAFSLSLRCDTEIPDLIAGSCVASQMLASDGILDAEFESDDAHCGSALLKPGLIKSASSAGKPLARSHFVLCRSHNIKRAR